MRIRAPKVATLRRIRESSRPGVRPIAEPEGKSVLCAVGPGERLIANLRGDPLDHRGCRLDLPRNGLTRLGRQTPRPRGASHLLHCAKPRRFTRLTNAFSKKIDNHVHALALYFAFYNFCRIHKTIKVTPAMAAGIADTLWSLEDIAERIEAGRPQPGKRGPYKKRVVA
jgi:hypothetical protein